MKRVVCFANREMGARIASDLIGLSGIHIVAVVTNDSPHDDLPSKSSLGQVPVMPWSRFEEVAVTDDLGFFAGVSALFRHRIPQSMLARFSQGIVNLHPSLLPFGRGSQPATWAIWQGEPYGASVHLMTEDFDAGPLLGQIEITVHPWDTSHSLYQRGVDALWDLYLSRVRPWMSGESTVFSPQSPGGTMHTVQDFKDLQLLARDSVLSMEDHVRLIRALSLGSGGGLKVTQSGVEVEIQAAVWPPANPGERSR